MVFFKNYSFEYNAQRVDVFKSTVVCSVSSDADDYREGVSIAIDPPGFYGVIVDCKNSGDKRTLDISAESWGRELRNTAVSDSGEFRQIDAIQLIKDHLLPPGWTLIYPPEFDTYIRRISYILRNGSYLSHISTVLDSLGLDFTIYSEMVGNELQKFVKAYYRDEFTDRATKTVIERVNIGNLTITSDYGKVATSITVMGAESEQGIIQASLDAEIGDWHNAPRALSIRDLQMSNPEFSADAKYFGYFPASEDDYTVERLNAGDIVNIGTDRVLIDSIWFMPAISVSSWESQLLSESGFPAVLRPITEYIPSGMIVASVYSGTISQYLESAKTSYSFKNGRNISNYFEDASQHGIYDPVLDSLASVSVGSYLTFDKNVPAASGIIWIGSERMFYRLATDGGSHIHVSGLVRGVPTCADSQCEHCGTNPLQVSAQCHLLQQSGYLYNFCDLAKAIRAKFPSAGTTDFTWCPLCFDNSSVCPALKCPHIKTDADFAIVCPKGLTKPEIVWTPQYQHHTGALVLPASYYYPTDSNGATADTYEIYARDSLIHKYGYLPTRISVKGIADMDGLDKIAEGRLRLSAIPSVGKCTLFNYDPWTVPASCFPGDVIDVTVATMSRYDHSTFHWIPSQWFDVSSTDPNSPDWVVVATGQWVKIREKFTIQKTTKNQRGMPEISFGAGEIGFQNLTDYIADTMDVTSQRHRNQDESVVIGASETGIAAKVQDVKTGKTTWVRMVR